jgi:DnaJ-class molecular chaperone
VNLRAIYDKYGEFGLKEGFINASGERNGGGYFMQSSPEAIYDKVYTSTDPWCETTEPDGTDAKGSMFSDAFRGLGHRHESDPVDIEVTVECTIAEFLMGSMKQINYQIC